MAPWSRRTPIFGIALLGDERRKQEHGQDMLPALGMQQDWGVSNGLLAQGCGRREMGEGKGPGES